MDKLDEFSKILTKKKVTEDHKTRMLYARDHSYAPSLQPDLVVRPHTSDEVIKVINLARDREMMPQGEHFEFFGRTRWTSDMVSRHGIDVYLPPDSLVDLELPTSCDKEYVRKYVIPRWPSQARTYEHDIIAIAPADEASMLTE